MTKRIKANEIEGEEKQWEMPLVARQIPLKTNRNEERKQNKTKKKLISSEEEVIFTTENKREAGSHLLECRVTSRSSSSSKHFYPHAHVWMARMHCPRLRITFLSFSGLLTRRR